MNYIINFLFAYRNYQKATESYEICINIAKKLDDNYKIRDSIESLEKQKLENDRDMRIDFLKLEKPLVEEWTVDKIEVEEENAVKDYTNSDDFLNKEITHNNRNNSPKERLHHTNFYDIKD